MAKGCSRSTQDSPCRLVRAQGWQQLEPAQEDMKKVDWNSFLKSNIFLFKKEESLLKNQ